MKYRVKINKRDIWFLADSERQGAAVARKYLDAVRLYDLRYSAEKKRGQAEDLAALQRLLELIAELETELKSEINAALLAQKQRLNKLLCTRKNDWFFEKSLYDLEREASRLEVERRKKSELKSSLFLDIVIDNFFKMASLQKSINVDVFEFKTQSLTF